MGRYVLKRVLISLVTIWVLVTVVFILVRLMPGEPFAADKMTPEVKANMMAYYGFDKPYIQQYMTYIGNLLHGNLGYSLKYPNQTVNMSSRARFRTPRIWDFAPSLWRPPSGWCSESSPPSTGAIKSIWSL